MYRGTDLHKNFPAVTPAGYPQPDDVHCAWFAAWAEKLIPICPFCGNQKGTNLKPVFHGRSESILYIYCGKLLRVLLAISISSVVFLVCIGNIRPLACSLIIVRHGGHHTILHCLVSCLGNRDYAPHTIFPDSAFTYWFLPLSSSTMCHHTPKLYADFFVRSDETGIVWKARIVLELFAMFGTRPLYAHISKCGHKAK